MTELADNGSRTRSAAGIWGARRGRWGYVMRELVRKPTFIMGAVVLLFWIVAAVAWPLLAPYSPYALDPLAPLQAPSAQHWLGTDELGRDVLSRVLAGSSSVMAIAPMATALCLAAGLLIALPSGYYRGNVDEVLMRMVDILISLPMIVVAIPILALIGRSTLNVTLVIAFLFAPVVSRTLRAAVLEEREREYVEAAQIRGESGPYIMVVEILPNIVPPMLVEGTIRLAYSVFTAATLAFLNLGPRPPSPDWGLTIAADRVYAQVAWWTVIFPALALASLIVAVNFIANALREVTER